MSKYLKKNRKLDQKKMISTRIRSYVVEAFQNASDEANKNGYSLTLSSVIEEALESSIAEYTEASGKDFLQIEKDKLEDEWEKLQKENNKLKEENKLLIDKANNDITKRYYENGAYEIDMFHNNLSRVWEEVAKTIRFLNPNAKFRITTPEQIFESFYESERNKKVVAIIHPYDFNENSYESILPLIEWKDPKAINPSKNEIIAQINKIREEVSKEMRAFIATLEKKNEQEELVF